MLLVDSNSISARAFFATHYGRGPDDFDERLFVGTFIRSLFRILWQLSGNGVAVLCVDCEGENWRKAVFPEYKANRQKLKETTPYAKYLESLADVASEMKGALPVVVVRKDPYEADDLIAYFAGRVQEYITVVTADKDMLQLCGKGLRVYNFVNEAVVETDANNEIADFVQLLTCIGDASDNIPSAAPRKPDGKPLFMFGEKTAPKYIHAGGRCGLSEEFWARIPKEDRDKVEEIYGRNKLLIDLSMSPVHRLFEYKLPEVVYNAEKVSRFLRSRINITDQQAREWLEMLASYGE